MFFIPWPLFSGRGQTSRFDGPPFDVGTNERGQKVYTARRGVRVAEKSLCVGDAIVGPSEDTQAMLGRIQHGLDA